MSQINDRLLEKFPDEPLKPKDWISTAHVGFQQDIVAFLLWAYGFLLVATVIVIFLQGFHLGGFRLEADFLRWLGIATVGQVTGLLTLTIRASFK